MQSLSLSCDLIENGNDLRTQEGNKTALENHCVGSRAQVSSVPWETGLWESTEEFLVGTTVCHGVHT